MNILKLRNLAIISSLLLLISCSSNNIQSTKLKSEIVIDGKGEDWNSDSYKTTLSYYDEKQVMVGAINDNDNLYIYLSTNNQDLIRQIMGMGMTIWFESSDNPDKKIGIKYPIGREMGSNNFRKKGKTDGTIQTDEEDIMPESLKEYEIIIGNNKEVKRLAVNTLPDIKAMGTRNNTNFTYELKIPLNKHNKAKYAIMTDTGKVISINFETTDAKEIYKEMGMRNGDLDASGLPYGGSGNMGGNYGNRGSMPGMNGGMGGMGGSRGGGRSRGMGGSSGPKVPDQFKFSANVKIAGK